MAAAASSARVRTPSFANTCSRWVFTVPRETNSRSPIAGLVSPAAATALHESMGQRCWFASTAERDRARAAAELGDDFPRIAAEGQRLDGPAAVAYALRARGERRRPSFGWDSLTPTELEVVRLAAAGLTNPAIGERLFISRGTVKTHLLHVFAKLGVHTRAELAAAAIRHGLG